MDFAILDPCLERDFPFTEDGIRVVGDHAGLIGHFVFDAIGGGFPFANFFKSKLFDFLSPQALVHDAEKVSFELGIDFAFDLKRHEFPPVVRILVFSGR